jgi:tetratricopeptide (TPR) repeat protein
MATLEIEQFEEKLDVLKNEVDALQVAVMKGQGPWYKQIPIIVAVVALLFSFSTTYVAYKKAEIEEIKNSRIELRGLLQRLSELPIEHLDYSAKYAQDSGRIQSIAGLLTQELSILSEQASEIARKLPRGYISAAEYYGLASGAANSYDFDNALMFYSKAASMTNNLNVAGASLRGAAQLLFTQNNVKEGRKKYREAIELSKKLASKTEFEKTYNSILTLASWTQSEAVAGNSNKAAQLLDDLESLLMTDNNSLAGLREQYVPFTINMRNSLRADNPGLILNSLEP